MILRTCIAHARLAVKIECKIFHFYFAIAPISSAKGDGHMVIRGFIKVGRKLLKLVHLSLYELRSPRFIHIRAPYRPARRPGGPEQLFFLTDGCDGK